MGVVSFKNVYLRYRSDLTDALCEVTFCTQPNEKVGIVGRTGSGKSSLFQALFRMVEIHQGDIKVDGMSIRYLDLKEIRLNIFHKIFSQSHFDSCFVSFFFVKYM